MLIASAACAVTVVAWTLIYFRPTVASFLEQQGGNAPAERLQAEAALDRAQLDPRRADCGLVVRSVRRVSHS